MKKNLLKALSITLSLILLISFGACQKSTEATNEEQPTKETYKPAAEFGITDYGMIPESALPNHEELENWYADSKERTSLVYAVFYAQDEASGIWYCWMWAEGFTAADTLNLSVDDSNGTRVHMDLTIQNEDAESMGAYCFAIPGTTEPSFALTVNEITEGLIVTLGSKAAIPLS